MAWSTTASAPRLASSALRGLSGRPLSRLRRRLGAQGTRGGAAALVRLRPEALPLPLLLSAASSASSTRGGALTDSRPRQARAARRRTPSHCSTYEELNEKRWLQS